MVSSSGVRPDDGATEPAFPAIVCGIAPGPVGLEAVRQAVVLAGSNSRVRFYGVRAPGREPGEEERALSDAIRLADAARINAAGYLLDEEDPAASLLRHVGPGELLVVGGPSSGRLDGILFGSVPTRLVHEGTGPVLIARRPPEDARFPREILLASDGSAGSMDATAIAAAIATDHDARVAHLHVGDSEPGQRRAMAVETAALLQAMGREPVIRVEDGQPVDVIVDTARREGIPLVVMGSRGLSGARAFGSVSERVAHEAPCSVLVARPGRVRP